MGAVTVRECTADAAQAKPANWNYEAEATRLIRHFQFENKALAADADNLQAMLEQPGNNSWQAHAAALAEAKSHVNHMNDSLCRLLAIKESAAPWQAELITRMQSDAVLSANNVEEAIQYLNHNQARISTVGAPLYAQHLKSVYLCAHEADKAIARATSLESARERVARLEQAGT
jgi:hypothetical protein